MDIKKRKQIKELKKFYDGQEIMIVGDHEKRGTFVTFKSFVEKDDGLYMRVSTYFGNTYDLKKKNIFINKKNQPSWN